MPGNDKKDKSPDKINIIRPDGTTFAGTAEQLKNLQLLGNYKQETLDDAQLRLRDEADKRAFSTNTEKLKTVGEGLLSGATLGGSDLLLNSTSSDLRAEANPKTRLGSEIVGGVLPALVPGGEFLPAGAVSKVAGLAGEAVGGGLRGAAVVGGIEGAGAGLQSTISTSTLTNTPITTESLRAGVGYGTFFGVGLNSLIHGAGIGLGKVGKKLEPEVKLDTVDIVNQENFQPFKAAVGDFTAVESKVSENVAATEKKIADVKQLDKDTIKFGTDEIKQSKKAVEDAQLELDKAENAKEVYNKDIFSAAGDAEKVTKKDLESGGLKSSYDNLKSLHDDLYTEAVATGKAAKESGVMETARRDALKAIKAGDGELAVDALNSYREKVQKVNRVLGYGAEIPEIKTEVRTLESGGKAASINSEANAKIDELQTKIDNWINNTGDQKMDLGLFSDTPSTRMTFAEYKNLQKEIDSLKTTLKTPSEHFDSEIQKAKDKLKLSESQLETAKASRSKLAPSDISVHEAELNRLAGVQESIRVLKTKIPHTATEFKSMGTNGIESLAAAIDHVTKNGADEFSALRTSVEQAVTQLVDRTGIKTEGSLGDQLREVWRIAKTANSKEIPLSDVDRAIAKTKLNTGDRFGKYLGASAIAHGTGTGAPGYFMARMGIEHMAAIVTGTQERLSKAAKAIGKTFTSKGKNYVVPKLEPLYTKIDGSRDTSTKNKNELARNRINELTQVAGTAPDIFYKAVEPLLGNHAEFAQGLHESLVNGFNALLEALPGDETGVQYGLKSTWKPDDVETLVTTKVLRAFYHPISVLEDAMKGKLDPIELQTVKTTNPELYGQCRAEILSSGIDFSKLNYREQSSMSTLLDLDLGTCFSGENIVDAQSQFLANPVPPPGNSSGSNPGGRPSKVSTGEPPTAAQSLMGQ